MLYSMLASLCSLCVCSYGYFRPHIRLFDPGWHGLQVKGEEDENTGDNGNDPMSVLARYAAPLPRQALVYLYFMLSNSFASNNTC